MAIKNLLVELAQASGKSLRVIGSIFGELMSTQENQESEEIQDGVQVDRYSDPYSYKPGSHITYDPNLDGSYKS